MRNISLTNKSALAVLCAIGIGCSQQTTQVDRGTSTGTNTCGDHHTCAVTNLLRLRDTMRELWTAHVAYTRFYIIESIAGLPEAPVTAARLLRNQDDIGDAIKPFYGDDAGNQLSALLRQ